MPINITKIPISPRLHENLMGHVQSADCSQVITAVRRFATTPGFMKPLCYKNDIVAGCNGLVGIEWIRERPTLWTLWGNEVAWELEKTAINTTKETIEHLRWDVQEYMILFPDSERLAALYDKLTFDSAIRVLKGHDGEDSSQALS